MKLITTLELENCWGRDDEDVASMIADEMKAEIKCSVKRAMKQDPKIKELIESMKEVAIKRVQEGMAKWDMK